MRALPSILFRFVILLLVQAFVLNNVSFGSWSPYVNGFLYVLFVMLLPYEFPRALQLVLSFALGLCLDAFTDTYGIHASALTLVAFVRPAILNMLASKDEYEFRSRPILPVMGFSWYFSYTFLMTFVHHFWVYLIDDFRFTHLHITLLKTVCSVFFTTLLIFLVQYIFYQPKKDNG